MLGRTSAECGAAVSAVRPLTQGEGAEVAAAEVVLAAAEAALNRTAAGGTLRARGQTAWRGSPRRW